MHNTARNYDIFAYGYAETIEHCKTYITVLSQSPIVEISPVNVLKRHQDIDKNPNILKRNRIYSKQFIILKKQSKVLSKANFCDTFRIKEIN